MAPPKIHRLFGPQGTQRSKSSLSFQLQHQRELNRRCKPRSIGPYDPCRYESKTSYHLAAITRELRRRNDHRSLHQIPISLFTEMYQKAIAGFGNNEKDPIVLNTWVHDKGASRWRALNNQTKTLKRGDSLKVASWNLYYTAPGAAIRASAALVHLKTLFGQEPNNLVVMFQEVCEESLRVILRDRWAQSNFSVTDIKPPPFYYHVEWNNVAKENVGSVPTRHFTLMMIPRHLRISNCFRVPFDSETDRDALVVHLPVSEGNGPDGRKGLLRLCTAHLESLDLGYEYRFRQLSTISALLKSDLVDGGQVYGGLVGGDMNSISESERNDHRHPEIDLMDAWEDVAGPDPPGLRPFHKDFTYGRAIGNTWGYQSAYRPYQDYGKRLDKFLYTGFIDTFPVCESQDIIGTLGRFGIGLKTKVGVNDVWVSDHFGITVGIKIMK